MVQGHVTTLMSNVANIEGAVSEADLVTCAVLIPGAKTPRLVTRRHLRQMEDGPALVDMAVDQGGARRPGRRPTTIRVMSRKASYTIASQICPAPCRIPRPTPSRSRIEDGAIRREIRRWPVG